MSAIFLFGRDDDFGCILGGGVRLFCFERRCRNVLLLGELMLHVLLRHDVVQCLVRVDGKRCFEICSPPKKIER